MCSIGCRKIWFTNTLKYSNYFNKEYTKILYSKYMQLLHKLWVNSTNYFNLICKKHVISHAVHISEY